MRQGERTVLLPLGEGVEHDVIGNLDDLLHVPPLERRRKDVVLLSRHLLVREPRLIEAACRRARKIFSDKRIEAEHGKRFLRQQDMCARCLLQVAQDREIPAQQIFHDNVGRRRHGREQRRISFVRSEPSLAHQSTSSGVKVSCHGRPQRFSASMNGSGSNCSML